MRCLSWRTSACSLRADRGAARHQPARRRGRGRRADRRQRRRQDHHHAGHLGHPAAVRRRILFNGEDITKLRADLRVRRGLCQSPEGRGIFPGMTVTENLDMGAYTRRDTRRHRRRPGPGARPLPAAGGAAQAGRRHAVRRRAADAGHRSGADEPAQAAAARRAVDGSGADAHPADLRHHHGDQRSRAPPSCWWSRTPSRRSPGPHRAYVLETGRIVKDRYRPELLTTRRSRRRTSACA